MPIQYQNSSLTPTLNSNPTDTPCLVRAHVAPPMIHTQANPAKRATSPQP
jgi:hypothetical protein